ncbi:MAG: aminotransferase class V-fold PLP-dependent enzyme [Caldilineaceae bacterium]|nr:aminotransferase class V-fold PLP-dependent enzyme [Caldilineaceae bacterium]
MQLSDVRRLTPITQEYAYFQSSGFSPKMEPVIEETNRWAQFQNAGGAAPGIHEKMLEGFEATREKVAQSMNADADEIVLGENTTIGINIVANGINWQAGDNVILSDKEHPGNRITWYSHVHRYGIELRFLEVVHDEEQMLEQFERLLDERTRVVSISHVCRRTGQRLPARALVDIAHDRGVPVLLDGAQAYGAVPVDMRELDCDFYAFSGHKYIMAPQGTGGFYVRRDMIPWIQPSWIGSHSQKDFDMVGGLTLLDEAKRFEFGTRNLADQIGFGKALDCWAEIGWEKVFAYIADFTDRLKAALQEVPSLKLHTPPAYGKSSGIVTFSLGNYTSAEIQEHLKERKVLVAPLELDGSMIRVSTHVFNNEDDLEWLVSGLVAMK